MFCEIKGANQIQRIFRHLNVLISKLWLAYIAIVERKFDSVNTLNVFRLFVQERVCFCVLDFLFFSPNFSFVESRFFCDRLLISRTSNA